MTRFRVLLPCLFALTAGACASSNAVPRPFPGAPVVAVPRRPAPAAAGVAAGTTIGPDTPATGPDGVTAGTTLTPDAPLAPGSTSHLYDGRAVAEYALALRGVPYRFGGSDPEGFDCSGLVHYVFAQYGIYVPRVVEDQWQVGDKVRPSEIRPGDLLFFSTKGPGATHVAIAVDSDHFVHAPNSAGVVRVEALSSTYWGSHYLGARRITNSMTTD
jgi:cell wall-associated NlpC family hydrolase